MATAKCSAASAASHGAGVVSLATALSSLNAAASSVSVEPSEYSWGAPSVLQQQALYSQFLQLAFMSACMPQTGAMLPGVLNPAMGLARPVFPGFMPPFAGFALPAPTCPAQSPSPPPCPPAPQPAPAPVQAAKPPVAKKAGPARNKSGIKKAGASHTTSVGSLPVPVATKVEDDAEMELDLCKLLGDDFLENLQEDVASEGSNGSSTTSDTRAMPRNHGSNSSLCASGSGSLANNFASAFDLDMDELPASAASPDWAQGGSGHVPPSKAGSADLNNLVSSSSPTKATRSARTAAREAAAAAKAAKEEVTTAPTKITLKVKGGVQKPAGGAKASRATAAACAAATGAPAAAPAAQGGPAQEECPLSAADLSRLLGEDDNRIPDGWDLDLDFENPFSCSITAF